MLKIWMYQARAIPQPFRDVLDDPDQHDELRRQQHRGRDQEDAGRVVRLVSGRADDEQLRDARARAEDDERQPVAARGLSSARSGRLTADGDGRNREKVDQCAAGAASAQCARRSRRARKRRPRDRTHVASPEVVVMCRSFVGRVEPLDPHVPTFPSLERYGGPRGTSPICGTPFRIPRKGERASRAGQGGTARLSWSGQWRRRRRDAPASVSEPRWPVQSGRSSRYRCVRDVVGSGDRIRVELRIGRELVLDAGVMW